MAKDDELSIDFSKVGDFLKRKKKASKAPEQPVVPQESTAPTSDPSPTPIPTASEKIDKKDDDISIDISKFTNWFKAKPESAQKNTEQASDDEDVSIDFSKIKGWFSSKEKTQKESKEDDIKFDFSKAIRWIKAHPILVILLILIIFQFVPNRFVIGGKDIYFPWGGIWLRTQNENLPPADGWAANNVISTYKNQLSQQIAQQYPNLPDERKNQLLGEEWNKFYDQQRATIDQQTQAVASQIKQFFRYDVDGKQYTYMPDIDTYQWLRYSRNYINTGKLGGEKDGISWDYQMTAPIGSQIGKDMHPYFLAWMYKVMRIFDSGIPLMQAAAYFPILMVLLALIPAFFIGRRFGGVPGGIIASTMIAIMPAITSRTIWGRADTDAYNVLFPVLCTWLFFEMIDAKERKQQIIWGSVLGLTLGIYAWAWSAGWWYIFDFMLITIAATLAFETYTNRRHIRKLHEIWRNRLTVLGTLLLSTGIFVTIFRSFWEFYSAPLGPLRFVVIKEAAHANLWPNVYTTVAELNPTNITGAIGAVGGNLLVGIAVIGILLMLFRKSEGSWKLDLRHGVFFALWLVAALYATTKGVRFTLMVAPVVALAAGIALGKIYTMIVRISSRDFNLNTKVAHICMILIISFMLAGQAKTSYGIAQNDIPIVNDAWWNALTNIKQDSQPDAIINSWWDFGHHFKYISERAVTFDGASQNTPMAHWIGRVLSTSDEEEAVGILRMLDCGSNKAFDTINKQLDDPVKSVDILYEIIKTDRKGARAILAREGIDEQSTVLGYTHCDPPENYFIASQDMIGKSGVWSHFGLWNFERAKLWIDLRNEPRDTAIEYMVKNWDYTEEEAEQAYLDVQAIGTETDANAWISPWPGILGDAACTVQAENVVSCDNGLQHNLSNDETVIQVNQGVGRPPMIVKLLENGTLQEIKFNDSNLGVAALLYPVGYNSYRSIVASPELLQSMFVKLYFLEGHGLKYFKEFDRQQLLTGGNIITYKVDWAGNVDHTYTGVTAAVNDRIDASKPRADSGDTVSVYYTGALLDNTVFDSSVQDWENQNITIDANFDDQDLKAPLKFTIGTGQVIAGFDAAVLGMKVGDEQVVQIPPNAAYGFDPARHALGNKTLRFKIRLVSIQQAPLASPITIESEN